MPRLNMNKERLSYLRLQYLSGNITSADLTELKSLVNNPDLDAGFSDLAEEIWMAPDSDIQPMSADEANDIYLQVTAAAQQKRPVKLWRRLAVAASVILIAGCGLYFLLNKPNAGLKDTPVYAADALPGKVGATLTLANGKQIALGDASKGELAKEAGVMITKQADGKLIYEVAAVDNDHKLNKLTTARGETYQVRLSDGTMVWLNADSKLTYAASLNVNKGPQERRVKLEGEAYFEVTKNKNSPFIVETGGQEVQVLGTHFNINSYADEPLLSTTLLEGSVRVTTAGSAKQAIVLSPGQQALNQQGNVKVVKANLEQVMDWKQGDFYLNHVNFKTAMRKIARWYNVEVVYDASVSDVIEAGGWISRNKKLSEILQSIEATEQVHFKVEGRKIIVFK
ncbi:FecR family protein [Pedobacter africanus]|uniref:FecR family protein n=2 Tax=Pedobacter africanus TaxID=151894 RepID=A0A1W2D9C3_9SPHI|nr:FecR family protein [Pedobacter africanus]